MTAKPPPKDPESRSAELAQPLGETSRAPGVTATPTAPARARSLGEMRFATTLDPCPRCGAPTGELDLYGDDDAYVMSGPCPRCATMRSFNFRTYGDPLAGAYTLHELGGRAPSEIISVARFIAELDRVLPHSRPDPTVLAPAEWRASGEAVDRAITCVLELLKFIPDGAAAMPESALGVDPADRAARPERYSRVWLEAERDRLQSLAQGYTDDAPRIWALEEGGAPAPAVRGRLNRKALAAHEQWVKRGQRGAGRLELVGVEAARAEVGAAELTGARLERVDFTEIQLGYAFLDDAELRDAVLAGANLTSASLRGARITGGSFAGAAMALAKLDDAELDGVDVTGADLDRSVWRGASVTRVDFTGARFGNAALDEATFVGTRFTDADFSPTTPKPRATTRGARFEGCDLRNTRWEGRDLAGASFVRCKLDGIAGQPASVEGVTIVEPDLSPAGDGSELATAEDVLELWTQSSDEP